MEYEQVPRRVSKDYIDGGYQYWALHHGHPVQRAWHRAKLDWIRWITGIPSYGTVLDAGCGSGVISYLLASGGAQVVGVDIHKRAVEFARKTFSTPNVDFRIQSIWEVRGSCRFDAVYLIECLEHFPDEDVLPLLEHLHGLTRPGGRLFLTTPNQCSLWPVVERALDLFHLVPRMRGEQHLSEFTPTKLRRVVAQAGWDILEMGSLNGIAPFAAVVSERLWRRLQDRERVKPHRLYRNLLYLYAEKRERL